jgi:hypothetical protein
LLAGFSDQLAAIYATHLCHIIALGGKNQVMTGFAFGLENQRVFTGTVGSNPTLSVQKTQSLTVFLIPGIRRGLPFLWGS